LIRAISAFVETTKIGENCQGLISLRWPYSTNAETNCFGEKGVRRAP
jgi:hypothetical protein